MDQQHTVDDLLQRVAPLANWLIRRQALTEAAFIICLPDLGGIERLEKQGTQLYTG